MDVKEDLTKMKISEEEICNWDIFEENYGV